MQPLIVIYFFFFEKQNFIKETPHGTSNQGPKGKTQTSYIMFKGDLHQAIQSNSLNLDLFRIQKNEYDLMCSTTSMALRRLLLKVLLFLSFHTAHKVVMMMPLKMYFLTLE